MMDHKVMTEEEMEERIWYLFLEENSCDKAVCAVLCD